MTGLRRVFAGAAGIWLCLALAGCQPGRESRLDEEREPHFLTAQNLARQMDYAGAVESYEQALLVNPRSASAHFELALLCESKTEDPAAAIYHYERYLKLAPDSGKADVVQAHINNCKLELARSVSTLVSLPASVQSNFEKLAQENRELKARLAQWDAAQPGRSQEVTPNPLPQNPPPNASPVRANAADPAGNARVPGPQARPVPEGRPAESPAVRTHMVKAGETPAGIARKYGVPLDSLLAANPEMKPRSLRIGATLKIPTI